MIKTFDDYYNDPSIAKELPAMREIHAIRLMNNDERKSMTAAEYSDLARKRADAFLN